MRKLARRKVGRAAASAAPVWEGGPVRYGSGLQGKRVKQQVARQGAQEAEALYQAIIAERQGAADTAPGDRPGYDPLQPAASDWQKVLERVAAQVGPALPKRGSRVAKRPEQEAAN